MTLRIDLKNKIAYPLDDVNEAGRGTEPFEFEDVFYLEPPVPERFAILAVSETGDRIDGIGMKVSDTTYIICEGNYED